MLADDDHAAQTNPPRGFLSSWNNKQAPGFSAADGTWGYGPARCTARCCWTAGCGALMETGPVTRTGLVEQVADAALADLRAEVLLPLLLDVVGTPTDPSLAVARAVLRPGLGGLVDELPQKIDDHPRLRLGSAWNNLAWYGYLSKELRAVLGRPVTAPFSQSYCGALADCRELAQESLSGAVARVLAEQGVADVGALSYDKAEDFIRPTTAGLVGTRSIDWQNRPTFQQVVSFASSRDDVPAAPLGAGTALRRRP